MTTIQREATRKDAAQGLNNMGLAAWVRTGTGKGKGAEIRLLRRLDLKRILALSAVLVTHTMVFGAMLLPAAPIAAIPLLPPEAAWIDVTRTPPPPPPPKVIPPLVRPTPKVQPVAVTPPPIDPPPIEPPILLATTAIPSEQIGSLIAPTIVEPSATVGGSVSESILTVLRAPAPAFPPALIRTAFSGTVEFSVLVGIDGTAQEIKLIRSSGNRKLDQSTLSHIKRRWLFKAPEVNGQVVPGWGRGKVTFTMEG